MRPVVVFTDDTIRREAVELLAPTCAVRVLRAYPSEQTLIDACRDADAILARLGTVTRGVIEAAPKLRIVARHGVGVDAVDLDAATARGVIVTTTGSVNAAAVAEYALTLLLALARKVVAADRGMREGLWSRDALVGTELDGRTLGVIGLGAIGRRVARAAHGFGMQVLAHDPYVQHPDDSWVTAVTLDELLAQAHFVTLHVRLTPQTTRLIDARAFASMQPGACLINTARGEVVDERALVDALTSRRLAGAALDTYEREPLPADSPLRRMANVVLSPHVAGQTEAALIRCATTAANAILDELAGRRPEHVYNPAAYDARASRQGAPAKAP